MKRNAFLLILLASSIILMTHTYWKIKGETKNLEEEKRTYFNIDLLHERVLQDLKGKEALMLGEDITVSQFLTELEEEHRKWNVSIMDIQEIKCEWFFSDVIQ